MVSKLFLLFCLLMGCAPMARGEIVHITSKQAGIDITTAKVTRISGVIDIPGQFAFEKQLAATMAIPGPRVIIINSGGGRVDIGNEMLFLMKMEHDTGVKMICVAEENAHSMAFNILTACDVRLATDDAHFIVHKIAISGFSPDVRITAKLLKSIADDLEHMDEPFRQSNSKAMHMSLEDYDRFADEQHCWSAPLLYLTGYLNGIATIDTNSPLSPSL
jgi:ATP-dependent protease ClpP protease subunit